MNTNEVTNQVKESAKNIYLAGMGAVSMAQEEAVKLYTKGSKESQKFYDQLIKEGKKFEKKSKKSVNETTEMAEKKVKSLKAYANEQVEKIERLFEARVENALHKLDIPTGEDMEKLSQKIDALTKEIKKLEKSA